MRGDFYKTRTLNGVQMYADNITSFAGTNQVLFIFQFLLLKGNKDDSTPFWFLKCRKMKSIISTIQSGAHLES